MFTRHLQTHLTDGEIRDFYLDLVTSGRERASYYSLPCRSVEQYLEDVRNCGAWWLLRHDGKDAGCFYLTGIEGKSAHCHFAFLPFALRIDGIPAAVALARYAVASTLYDKYNDGIFMLDTLVGITPEWNRAAVKLHSQVGGQRVGVVPNYCHSFNSQTMHPGVIAYFTRESVPVEWAQL